MQARNLGLLSALIGAACCVGPAFLAILGVFGFAGGFLATYHWYFIGIGGIGVAVAWWQYGRERGKLRAMASRMRNERVTRAILVFATALIVIVTGLDAYPLLARRSPSAVAEASSSKAASSIVIPTAGMDCAICAVPIKARLKQLPGVSAVEVSIEKGTVSVKYDPAKVKPEQLVAAIDSTGYKATLPRQ
jgi:copper chaperone CopZ